MDLFSYLLGKESGGGGGSTGLDWTTIGFPSTPQSVIEDYNYAKTIYDEWDSSQTSMNVKFSGDTDLVYMPSVDISNATTCQKMFYTCSSLLEVASLNLSDKCTSCNSMFYGCSKLRYLDCSNFDTSKVTTFKQCFSGCNSIEELDLSSFTSESATDIQQMFYTMNNIKKIDIRKFVFSTVTTYTNLFGSSFPTDCLIIVKDDTEKTWITTNFSSLTNVKTVAEL